jgi:hypothetical protein
VRSTVRVACAVVVVIAAAGCAKAGDESGVRRAPVSPPPETVPVPADLRIEVTIDGAAAEPITAATLNAAKPDFSDEDRQAWRLAALLPALATPGASVEAVGRDGVGVRMPRGGTAGAPEPVLILTRRGDVVASAVTPDDPFPDFHGEGGRLRRPGDPRPRVSPIVALRVSTRP